MKTYQDLLKTKTYWKLKIQNDLFNALEDYLEETGMTRTQFAKQLGVSKGYISQVLNGDFNHKISKLIELSLAIGKAPILEFENLEEVTTKESQGQIRLKSKYIKRPAFSVQIRNQEFSQDTINKPRTKQNLKNFVNEQNENKWESAKMIFYTNKGVLSTVN